MIPYIEIIDKYTLKRNEIIEPRECWFELSFFEIGEFEIRANVTRKNLEALKKGNYVKLPNKRFIWVITSVSYTFTAGGARLIIAKGYEAKWLLKKRIIQEPKELQGTITSCVYNLVNYSLGRAATNQRKINGFSVDTNNLLIDISGTQAPRGNLLDFVNNLLKTYNVGSQVIYENGGLKYTIINGKVLNASVKFSQSLDNLLSSTYLENDEDVGTFALVVSKIDDIDYPYTYNIHSTIWGIDRSEILVNSNLSTKYEDSDGVEQETTPTSALFQGWQRQEAINELANHKAIKEASGEIDLTNSNYNFDSDFFIGDIVGLQDEYFNVTTTAKILKYTISLDTKGHYAEAVEYGE